MINHVRTIILNEHNSVAGVATGLPHAEVIDPAFVPFAPPTLLQPIHVQLYPSGASIAERLVQTRGIMTLLHRPLLEPYIIASDPRITYSLIDNLSNTIAFDATLFVSRIERALANMTATSALFHNPAYDAYVTSMYKLWSNGMSSPVRVAAALLAYAYKCDQVRPK